MNQYWTEHEIQQLRTAFLQGKRLKIIAREMGRTPTALNKAISRFGIRPMSRPKKQPNLYLQGTVRATQCRTREQSCTVSFPPLHKMPYQVTDLEKVLHFLDEQGISVQTISLQPPLFMVQHAPMNARQILLKANQIRTQNNLPIFSISYLMD